MEDIDNKITSGIMGFAIGDALGVPVEFLSRKALEKYKVIDMYGFGTHPVPRGTWSDDTSLMLATMNSIIEKKTIDYNDLMTNFSNWYLNAEYTATDELFDIGKLTRIAIENYLTLYTEPTKCGGTKTEDNGNGSLMRMLPIAIYLYYNNLDELEKKEIISNVSSLTHAHEISVLGCHIFCDYIINILNGNNKIEALNSLRDIDYESFYSSESLDMYKKILDGSISNETEENIKSSGYVVDTLEASIWCTLNSNQYEEAVLKAVNLGEDTDTVGAITGGINGIIYQSEGIPQKWVSKLIKNKYISSVSNEFIESMKQNNKGL